MSSDGIGFHVGRYYQMLELPPNLMDTLGKRADPDNDLDALDVRVACARIDELRKHIGKTMSMRSSKGRQTTSATYAVVTVSPI